jgi:hypothetical protein
MFETTGYGETLACHRYVTWYVILSLFITVYHGLPPCIRSSSGLVYTTFSDIDIIMILESFACHRFDQPFAP